MLEIRVFDKVIVADSLKKAVMIILDAFKKWVGSDSKKPLDISIKKLSNKAPPVLEVNVSDKVITKTAFG